jgi:hypothetical protein
MGFGVVVVRTGFRVVVVRMGFGVVVVRTGFRVAVVRMGFGVVVEVARVYCQVAWLLGQPPLMDLDQVAQRTLAGEARSRAASGPDRVTARRATRVCQLLGARQKITQQLKRVLTSQV